MLTSARIERLREIGGIGWVSCLRAPAIRALVDAGDLQLGLFDEREPRRDREPRVPGRAPRRLSQPGPRGGASEEARGAPGRDRGGAREGGRDGRTGPSADGGRDRPARRAGRRRQEDGQALRARHRRRPVRLPPAGRRDRRRGGPRRPVRRAHERPGRAARQRRPSSRRTSACPASSATSGRSRATTCWSARSSTGGRTGSARTSSCASSRPTCAGTSRPPGPRSSIATRRRLRVSTRSPRPSARPEPWPRSASTARPTGSRSTASGRSCADLATLTATGSCPPALDERAAFEQLSVPTPLQDRAFELIGISPASV